MNIVAKAWRVSLVVAVPPVAFALVAAWALWLRPAAEPVDVAVFEGPTFIALTTHSDAIAIVEKIAGFKIAVPSVLPTDRLSLNGAFSSVNRDDTGKEAPASKLQYFERDTFPDPSTMIMQIRQSTVYPGRTRENPLPIDLDMEGVDAWAIQTTESPRYYIMRARGFYLYVYAVVDGEAISEEEAISLLRDLVGQIDQ